MVKEWHRTLGRPEGLSDAEYAAFIKFAMGFVLDSVEDMMIPRGS